jgi:L-amino acid ligase
MKTVIICDAYSTGAKLAPLFREQGVKMAHVRSSEHLPSSFLETFRPKDFDIDFGYMGPDLEAISRRLAAIAPDFVIAGTESGVELAETLSDFLSTPSNAIGLATSRRNKFAMNEVVRAAGLKTAIQMQATSSQELENLKLDRFTLPVVVKPTNSAGGDGFRICGSRAEIRNHAQTLFNRTNAIGEVNEGVLVQEYLQGQQYFVNSTSIGGHHYVSEVWRDERRPGYNGSIVCWKEDLLPLDGEIQSEITAYVYKVLNALGVREGASHTELMLTGSGPVLIESAARMQGTIDETAVRRAIGLDVVSLNVLRYARPGMFEERFKQPIPRRASISCVSLVSHQEGRIKDARGLQEVRSLPSFYSAIHLPMIGSAISQTSDLFTSPGIIYLVGDEATIAEDHLRIREMEQAGEIFHVV